MDVSDKHSIEQKTADIKKYILCKSNYWKIQEQAQLIYGSMTRR